MINIPEYIKSIRFDIGLSYCAPNSAIWLDRNPYDLFVIGIEPNEFSINSIKKNGIWCDQLGIKPFKHKHFHMLEMAIDNVEEPTFKKFYNMNGDPGTSSMLMPTSNLNYSINSITNVYTISLKEIIEKLPQNRFDYIELIKIDTQGKDLDILKSAKEFLQKIAFINCEINTFNHYKDNPKPSEFELFLKENGFVKLCNNSFVDNQVVDATYINAKYKHLENSIDYFVL